MEKVGVEFSIVSDKAEKSSQSLSNKLLGLDNATTKANKNFSALRENSNKLGVSQNAFTQNIAKTSLTLNDANKRIERYTSLLGKQAIGSDKYLETQRRLLSLQEKINPSAKIEKATDSIKQLNAATKETAKTSSSTGEGFKNAAGSALQFAKGILIANGVMKIMSGLMNSFPQIGEMMGEIGQIISMNLFKPLANEVIPIIKKLGVWVANNKALFIQLGNVIANAFRGVMLIAKTVFGVIQALVKGIFGGLTSDVKTMGKGISDFFNFLILKVTFALTFLAIFLEPIFSALGKTIRSIWDNALVPFFDGLTSAFSDSSADVEGFQNGFINAFNIISEVLKTISPIFKYIGIAAAWTFKIITAPTRFMIGLVFDFINILAKIPKAFEEFKNAFERVQTRFNNFKSIVFDGFKRGLEQIRNSFSGVKEIILQALLDPFNKIMGVIDTIISKFNFIQEGFAKIKSLGGSFFGSGEESKTNPIQQNTTGSAKLDAANIKQPTSVRNENNVEYKPVFNITGESPQEIAKEVEKIQKKKVDSPKKQFNKFAPAQGLL